MPSRSGQRSQLDISITSPTTPLEACLIFRTMPGKQWLGNRRVPGPVSIPNSLKRKLHGLPSYNVVPV